MVADPKSALDTAESRKIIAYINQGGNAISYGEPGKQDILNPLLRLQPQMVIRSTIPVKALTGLLQ